MPEHDPSYGIPDIAEPASFLDDGFQAARGAADRHPSDADARSRQNSLAPRLRVKPQPMADEPGVTAASTCHERGCA